MEGSKVRYVGDDIMVGISTVGKVLAASGSHSAHVQWMEGNRQGQVDLVPVEDLVPYRTASAEEGPSVPEQFEASLEHTSMLTVAVRDVYDEGGEEALLTALDEAGHLAMLAEHAADVIGIVAGRLRQDANFSLVLAQLDDFEAESLLSRVAVSLLKNGEA